MTLRLLVVADDLTGAHDCAARLTALGGPVPSARSAGHLRGLPGAKALVLDAETRFLKPREARWRSTRAWAELGQAASAPWRFHKLDSTLRGNPGEEVEGLAAATAAPWVAVLPAYPRAGRTTLNGRHYVNGQPLEASEFARDPLSPARVARPQDLFRADQRLHVPLAWVRSGLSARLRRALRSRPARFVTFDCLADADVDRIAKASVHLGCRHFAGASALAGSLARLLGPENGSRQRPPLPPAGLPWMILAGSLSERSLEQLSLAQVSGCLRWAAVAWGPSVASLRGAQRKGTLALSTVRRRPASFGRRSVAAGEAAIGRLVSTALKVVPDPSQAAWLLTGGHSALRFFEAASLLRFDVMGEALPGLAWGRAEGPRGGAWIATKPGGFGQADLYPRFLDLVQAR